MILGEMDTKTKETINAMKARSSKDPENMGDPNPAETVNKKDADNIKVVDLDAENREPNKAKEKEEKPVILEDMTEEQKKTYLLDQLIKDRENQNRLKLASE